MEGILLFYFEEAPLYLKLDNVGKAVGGDSKNRCTCLATIQGVMPQPFTCFSTRGK